DTDIAIPAGTPQDKVDAYKAFLRSSAYAIIGTIQFNREKYADAEASLRKSIDADPQNPDPVAIFRLAVALDKQDKVPEALKYAEQAVSLTKEGTAVGTAARNERDRLVHLNPGGRGAGFCNYTGSVPPLSPFPRGRTFKTSCAPGQRKTSNPCSTGPGAGALFAPRPWRGEERRAQ